MSEPAVIYSGASLKWKRAEDSTYSSANGYTTLLYEIYNKDAFYTISETTTDGSEWTVEVASATTDDWDPGRYDWMVFATKTGEKWLLAAGTVEIKKVGIQQDGRSFWRRVRDALQATLENKATRDQISLSIAGRSIGRMSPQELNDWLDRATREVAKEDRAARVADGETPENIVRIEF